VHINRGKTEDEGVEFLCTSRKTEGLRLNTATDRVC
jgi:hypothetical protein